MAPGRAAQPDSSNNFFGTFPEPVDGLRASAGTALAPAAGMSQINVNPSGGPGPYYDDVSTRTGINLVGLIVVLVFLVVIALIAFGATAGHWFSGAAPTTGGTSTSVNLTAPSPSPAQPNTTNITISLPAAPASRPVSPVPAASR